MATDRTIQAHDSETVLQMYRSMNVLAFGLFLQSEPLFGAVPETIQEGEQLLEQWLDWIKDSKSAAIYSLRVYRKITDEADITNKTNYNCSVRFRLNELSMAVGGAGGNAGYFMQFTDTINGLRSEVKELKERLDDQEGDQEP